MATTMNKVKHVLHLDKDKNHTTSTTGTSSTGSAPVGTQGPHSSRVGNAADPTVDSDLSSHNGASGGYSSTGNGTTGTNGSTTTPHNSKLANTVDPRVDSTNGAYSGSHAGTNLNSHTGTTGGISSSTNAGPHDSNIANKVDPRVDSDLDGRGNRHGAATGGIIGASGSHATAGSGTAQNTAGPHNSDLLNQVDPRVDSDRDGSKTLMGNKTHA